MHVRSRHFATLAFSALALATSACLHAQEAPPATASEWGGMGLLQTPSARMADDGEISFTASHNSPYSRYNVTMQPFPWLEGHSAISTLPTSATARRASAETRTTRTNRSTSSCASGKRAAGCLKLHSAFEISAVPACSPASTSWQTSGLARSMRAWVLRPGTSATAATLATR